MEDLLEEFVLHPSQTARTSGACELEFLRTRDGSPTKQMSHSLRPSLCPDVILKQQGSSSLCKAELSPDSGICRTILRVKQDHN
eukprot:scaffold14938_cov19-Tisochrysis_lutea.AAC.2